MPWWSEEKANVGAEIMGRGKFGPADPRPLGRRSMAGLVG